MKHDPRIGRQRMLRLAHVSDIHLYTPARWGLRDWLSKRVAGWVNSRLLTRGRSFRHAPDTLRILVDDIHARKPDLLIFSGDASTLGFGAEFDLAARLLRVGEPDAIPCLAVPGNHDYYTPGSVQEGAFERSFAAALEGERGEPRIKGRSRERRSEEYSGANCTTKS